MRKRIIPVGMALLVFAGAAAAQELVKDDNGIFVTRAITGEVAMTPAQTLVINAASSMGGDITLTAGATRCRYSYVKRLNTPTKKEAAEYAEVISVEIEERRDEIVFYLRAPARAPWGGTSNSGRLDIHIEIPDNRRVKINTAYFDIDATGPFAEFDVTETLSAVRVENVRGRLDARVSNRPLAIYDVRGQVFAANKYGSIKLEDVITGESSATIRNEHGEISLDACQGSFDLRTSYARIVGRRLFLAGSDNRIKNVSGVINLELDSLTSGNLRLYNNYESIWLSIDNRIDADFICKIEEGNRVIAEQMDMVPSLVYDTRLEFTAGEGEAEVRLTANGSGDINIVGPGTKGE